MINNLDEKLCCGCRACEQVCSKHCIFMKTGTLGALYASVDSNRCIECGACERVCPIINSFPKSADYKQSLFAAISKDSAIRKIGSSGSVFPVAAIEAISENYIVYGAGFNKNLQLKCMSADSIDALAPLYKSKYLQSDMSSGFCSIKEKLAENKKVLFISTPCQIAALKLFLNREYDNLLTIDFFCHGVSSQSFFNECTEYEDKKNDRKTKLYEFRTKVANGRTPHYFTIVYEKGNREYKKTSFYFDSSFYAAFQQYVSLRESCYECKFAIQKRWSDITIGDFHDINSYVKNINRFDGVSTVIVNSEKGECFWNTIKDSFEVYAFDVNNLIKNKVIFNGHTLKPANRNAFVKLYKEGGIEAVYKKFLSPLRYTKHRIYYSLPNFIRMVIKKIIGGKLE